MGGAEKMNQLHLRLKNCLETILDLEPGIKNNNLRIFESDFLSLREYLAHIEQIPVVEEDVERFENATARFLREISRGSHWVGNCDLLQ